MRQTPALQNRGRALGLCLLLAAATLLATTPVSSAAAGAIAGSVSATPPRYLAETVVYLEGKSPGRPPTTVEMDQKGMRFLPHVLAVTVGDTVRFWNHDTVPHNIFSPEGDYNLGVWPPGEFRDHTFTKQGAFSQLCSLHPEMLAYVFVAPNAAAVAVSDNGRFNLPSVPPGTYRLAVWNSHLKAPAQTVEVKAGKTAVANISLHR